MSDLRERVEVEIGAASTALSLLPVNNGNVYGVEPSTPASTDALLREYYELREKLDDLLPYTDDYGRAEVHLLKVQAALLESAKEET